MTFKGAPVTAGGIAVIGDIGVISSSFPHQKVFHPDHPAAAVYDIVFSFNKSNSPAAEKNFSADVKSENLKLIFPGREFVNDKFHRTALSDTGDHNKTLMIIFFSEDLFTIDFDMKSPDQSIR